MYLCKQINLSYVKMWSDLTACTGGCKCMICVCDSRLSRVSLSVGLWSGPRARGKEKKKDKVSLSPAESRAVYRAPWCLSAAGIPTPPRRTGHQCLIHVGSVNIQRPPGWQICHASLLPEAGRSPSVSSAHGIRAHASPGRGHRRPGRVVLCDWRGGERVSAAHYNRADTKTHTDMCVRVQVGARLFEVGNKRVKSAERGLFTARWNKHIKSICELCKINNANKKPFTYMQYAHPHIYMGWSKSA